MDATLLKVFTRTAPTQGIKDVQVLTKIHNRCAIKMDWCSASHEDIPNTPDITVIDAVSRSSRLLKYQPLLDKVTNQGFSCKLDVFVVLVLAAWDMQAYIDLPCAD